MKTKKRHDDSDSDVIILGHCLINGVYNYKVIGLQNDPEEKFIPAREVPSHSIITAYWRQFSFDRQITHSAKIEDVLRENEDDKEPEELPLWPEEEKIEILGILKNKSPLQLAVKLPNSKDISIVPSSYLRKKYPFQLSIFYEQNIIFQNTDLPPNS
ncbi:hypothetical protein M9Y10_025633 [Tritrichomonas musculus]|uniref:Uncharacterized protein n=1 Tax=Tritrichomonas musculus TaxID=1915356 RepID=A0ABR2H978_9EUKA